MNNLLKAGIIGCGRMGKIRAQSTINSDGKVVLAVDSNEEMVTEFKSLFPDCMCFTDLEDFNWDLIDIVFICSPPVSHIEHINMAIKHRKPFLIEKPISINSKGINEIVNTIKLNPLINAVGYMNRYRPSVQSVKTLSFIGVSSYWVNKMYQVPWWQKMDESGGPLNEQATHLLDLNRFVIGEVSEVYAASTYSNTNFPTTISINLKFKNGLVGNILYSCDALSKSIGMDLFSKDGKLSLSGWDFNLADSGLQELTQQDIFDIETSCFMNAVSDKNQQLILCDLEDACQTQLLVDAVNESIKAGKPVQVMEAQSSYKSPAVSLL